jgi:Leucine-rich repeat (LRR) protein
MNNISDLTPLAGLTNLEELHFNSLIGGNPKISDITPLVGLSSLKMLSLNDNNISDSQIALLEEVLPNTGISW